MPNNYSTSLKRRESPEHLQALESDVYYEDGYYGASVSDHSEKQMLLRFLSVLKKYWPLIAAMTLLVTSLVVVYEAQKPDYYTADVRIQINNEMNPASGGSGSSSIVLPGNDPGYFSTQLQILEGSGLLRRVVKTLDLENNEAFLDPLKGRRPGVLENIQRMFGLYKPVAAASTTAANEQPIKLDLTDAPPAGDLDDQAEALAPYVHMLRGGLSVQPVKDSRTANKETRLIEVEFTHNDPQVAAKVVNSLADIFVLQNLERKVESNASAGDFLQKRVAELQSQIRIDEERLINYAKSNQILSLDTSQNTVVQRLSDLHAKLNQAEGERINAETAYRAALQNPMRASIAETKDPRTAGLETQLTALRQTLVQLKTEFTDEWPEVKKVRGQIAAIEKELEANKKRSSDTEVAALEQAYRQAAAKENELRSYFASQRQAVLTQNEAAVNYRIIQQEIDTNKDLLESLLKRFRETEVVLNGTPNNVHVVDRALVPRSPAGPQRTKNIVFAFFASLLGGLGLAFLLTWLDDTVRPKDDLELQLGTPVIGLIPSTGNGRVSLLPSKLRRNGNGNHRVQDSYELEKFQRPVVAEAFNQLRTSLLLSNAGGAPQTVLVTSGQPSEGKTITSLNLARSLAQLGERVLLIDADLRSPKMHLLTGLDNKKGLSNLLTIKTRDDDTIRKTIHQGLDANLDLLTAGPQVPNPSNLFSSPEMSKLLEQLCADYGHIVIDSPPILYFADSVILANTVDAVVLMARANVSSREILSKAKKVLLDVRANIVGIVMNDVPLGSFKYYNNSYYRQLDEPEERQSANVLHLD